MNFITEDNIMEAKKILRYLKQIAKNNNRPWFMEHKIEYEEIRASFEDGVQKAILKISVFDPSIAHITVKDAIYRFYRDTRFSEDKSPYKRHLGAYIAAHGKKALHGGYYIHLEPGNCLIAAGNYYLPTNILTSCRNEIMGNIEEWLRCVANKDFLESFGDGKSGSWGDEKGFGIEKLKTAPAGFPRDYEYIQYLRLKDYCCWRKVPDTFFEGDSWLDEMSRYFQIAKPMMDFTNAVIDDYE